MSKQYDDFIAELAILCNKHNLQIVTSQYDTIQVWIKDKNDPIECFEDKFEDKTELTEQKINFSLKDEKGNLTI